MGPWDPSRYRELLHVWARRLHLDPRLQRRFDSSDLVQETMLKAYQGWSGFGGVSEGERIKWLHQIFANTVCDKVREAKAAKRNLDRELVQTLIIESSDSLQAWLAAVQSSPSQQLERQELLLQATEALARLPEAQRDVIIQHHMMGIPVSQIAAQMNGTTKSVAGLLYRGLKTMRELMDANPGADHDKPRT